MSLKVKNPNGRLKTRGLNGSFKVRGSIQQSPAVEQPPVPEPEPEPEPEPTETLRNLNSFDSSQELTIGPGGAVQADSLSLNKDGTIFVSTANGNKAHLYNRVNNTFEYSHTFDVFDANGRGCGQSLSNNALHFVTTSWTASEIRILSRATVNDPFDNNFVDFEAYHFDGITSTKSTGATFIGDDGEYLIVYFHENKKLRLYTRVNGVYEVTNTFDVDTYNTFQNQFFRMQATYLANEMVYLAVGDYGKPFTLFQLSNIASSPSLVQIKTVDDPDDGAGDSHGLCISGDGTVIIVGSHAQNQTGFFKYVNTSPSDVTGWSTSILMDDTIAARGAEMSGDGSIIMYGSRENIKLFDIN